MSKRSGNKQKIFSFFLNSWVLAFIFILPVALLFIPKTEQYKTEIIHFEVLPENDRVIYNDLNCDGISEKIVFRFNLIGNACYKVLDDKNKLIDQWNFKGKYYREGFYWIKDLNGNGYKEVCMLTCKNDSMFLFINEPLGKDPENITKKFIDIVAFNGDNPDFTYYFSDSQDINGDGVSELYFEVEAGYSLKPRRIYRYDMASGELIKSPDTGVISTFVSFFDLSGDSIPEIVTSAFAPDNYVSQGASHNYIDTYPWLMAFNSDLEFLFPPIPFSESKNVFRVTPFLYKGEAALLVFKTGEEKNEFLVVDSKGNILTRIDSSFDWAYLFGFYNSKGKYENYAHDKNSFYFVNDELKVKKIADGYSGLEELKFINRFLKLPYTFFASVDGLLIFNEEMEEIAKFEELSRSSNINVFLSVRNYDSPNFTYCVQSNREFYEFQIKTNWLYWFQYLMYGLIFGLFVLVLELVKRQQQKVLEQKQYTRQQILSLQLKSVQNQVDPHFIFNALNSAAAAVYEEDKNVAYEYLAKLSLLMRKSLEKSDAIEQSWKEEMQFIKMYLEIQKFRFNQAFDFFIVDEINDSEKIYIPKMLVFNFVENAIKHGLIPKKEGGRLLISAMKVNNFLKIIVDDNGVGRGTKLISEHSTGKGLVIADSYIGLFRELDNRQISYQVTDKIVEGESAGTKVEIHIGLKETPNS